MRLVQSLIQGGEHLQAEHPRLVRPLHSVVPFELQNDLDRVKMRVLAMEEAEVRPCQTDHFPVSQNWR